MMTLRDASNPQRGVFDPPDMILRLRPSEPSRYRYSTHCDHQFRNSSIFLVVPKGTKTDLASIPWFMRLFFSSTGRWQRAAVFHDRACGQARSSEDRHLADVMFRNMCRLDGVDRFTATILYVGVRIGAAIWLMRGKR